MNCLKFLSLLFIFLTITSCDRNHSKNQFNTATVYTGGDIITMAGDTPNYAEAIVVNNGVIEFVGAANEAVDYAGAGHRVVDLDGKRSEEHTSELQSRPHLV